MATTDIQVLSVFCSPAQPQPGQSFTLTVTLNSEPTTDVQVTIEKQRLIIGPGAVQTAPTGSNYFVDGFHPTPIAIAAGGVAGVSSPIKVKANAQSDTGTPVIFPDYVIFTAYIGTVKSGFVPDMVMIQKHSPVAATPKLPQRVKN